MKRAGGGKKRGRLSGRGHFLTLGFLLGFLGPTGVLVPGAARALDARLVWVLSPEADTGGYRVYHGTVSRYEESFLGYPFREELRAGDFEVADGKGFSTLTGLSENLSTWVSLTAYDANGNESGFSNEKRIAPSGNPGPGPVVPCQATAPGFAPTSVGVGLPGWVFFFLTVPAWILLLRPRVAGKPFFSRSPPRPRREF